MSPNNTKRSPVYQTICFYFDVSSFYQKYSLYVYTEQIPCDLELPAKMTSGSSWNEALTLLYRVVLNQNLLTEVQRQRIISAGPECEQFNKV